MALMFPSNWPAGCPPAEARPADGEVYRLVKSDPPVADDFATWLELGKSNPARECESAGLSVFRNLEDATNYAGKYPHLGERVAKGSLGDQHGITMPTPRRGNSHLTWWPYEGIIRHSLFSVIDS